MPIPAEAFFLSADAAGTLQSRIRGMVVQGVLAGRLRPGDKMPSSRGLAGHLGVSRITVTLAYAELVSADYLTAKGRSGYFISDTAPVASEAGTVAAVSACAVVDRAPAASAQIAARWLLPEPSGPTSSITRFGQSGQRSTSPSASALAGPSRKLSRDRLSAWGSANAS